MDAGKVLKTCHTPGSHGMHCDAGSATKLQSDRKTTLGREEQREPPEAMHARIRTDSGLAIGMQPRRAPSTKQKHQAPLHQVAQFQARHGRRQEIGSS